MSEAATLPIRPRRRLPTVPVLLLSAVLVAAAGFVGGVLVQKHAGGGAGTGAAAATGAPARQAGAGFSFGRGGGETPVTGQVKTVDGRRLYVTRSDGTTVEVRVKSGAKVTRTAKSSVGAVHPGDTVIVTGTSGRHGTISAASVTATARGASGGGFGGGFGRGGGGFGGFGGGGGGG